MVFPTHISLVLQTMQVHNKEKVQKSLFCVLLPILSTGSKREEIFQGFPFFPKAALKLGEAALMSV